MPRLSNCHKRNASLMNKIRNQAWEKRSKQPENEEQDSLSRLPLLAKVPKIKKTRKKKRREQCNSMRTRRWTDAVRAASDAHPVDDEEVVAPQGPTLRSSMPYKKVYNVNKAYVVNLDILTTCLRECQNCHQGPLDLANIWEDVRSEGVCPVVKVRCVHCCQINILRPAEHHRSGRRGPPAFDINSRTGLGALHSGIGHSNYTGLLSTLGLPSLASSNFKTRERESGIAIEAVAQASCGHYTAREKRLSASGSNEGGTVEVGVSYDMGWRKRGRSHDSSSGAGTAIGQETGKVLNYATRNTMCRVCKEAEKNKQEPAAHDCRKNHYGSSKSMEPNVAVQLFSDAVSSGVRYLTYVGDDDSTTENHLKTLVNYSIEKWSDINHVTRVLGNHLYSAKGKVKGLTPTVIAYVQRCFTYCIHQNKGQQSSLLKGLSTIIPHAFGEHGECEAWCKYKEDPENYKHRDLPGGKDLRGEELRASLEEILRPFLTEEAARKMAPVKSSQRNECVNSIIGTKAPKIRHYGGSESADFRTAAGVAQFNEGHDYIAQAAKMMGLAQCTTTGKYARTMKRKREQDTKRRSSKAYKRARRDLRKKRTQKTHSQEGHEGVTYESSIALHQGTEEKNSITNATIDYLKASLTREEFTNYAKSIKTPNEVECQGRAPASTANHPKEKYLFLAFDTETTGLGRTSELLQTSCTSSDGSTSFSTYLLPDKRNVADSATRVNGITAQYRKGRKVLVKRGEELEALTQVQGLTNFCNFLQQHSQSHHMILIAHNGNRFDFPVLFNALKTNNLLDAFISYDIMLLDSLKLISNEMKQKTSVLHSCKRKGISDLHEFLLNEKFEAHDAKEDAAALSRILFQSPLKFPVQKLVEDSISAVQFAQEMKSGLEAKARKSTLETLPISKGMKEKLGKAALDLTTMQEIYKKGGSRALLAVLALPEVFDHVNNKISKPRVTKNLKVLTKIVNCFVQSRSQ